MVLKSYYRGPGGITLLMPLLFFGEKFITESWNKINHFAILKHFYPNPLVFPAKTCLLQALGICAEDLWIRADFFYEIRW